MMGILLRAAMQGWQCKMHGISDFLPLSLLDYMLAHVAQLVLLYKHFSKELNK